MAAKIKKDSGNCERSTTTGGNCTTTLFSGRSSTIYDHRPSILDDEDLELQLLTSKRNSNSKKTSDSDLLRYNLLSLRRKHLIGVVVGTLGGLFTAVNLVPFLNWTAEERKKPKSGIHLHHFILSQTLGIFITSVTVYAAYYLLLTYAPTDPKTDKVFNLFKRSQLQKSPPMGAGLAAGVMWAAGFACILDAVVMFGMGVGYVIGAIVPKLRFF